MADGRRQQTPLCEDKEASQMLLNRLQVDADRQRALGLDRITLERQRLLTELVREYETHLKAKANTDDYVIKTVQRINALVHATKAKTLNDLDAGRISATLATWRKRKRRALGVVSTNHYTRAIKSFSRWLWIERRTADDILISLRMLNDKADRRHVRRAITADELRRLLAATEASGRRLQGMRALDRSILYLTAAYTGLRASELASLTVASFNLEDQSVSVQACYSKHRRNDTLPLHPSLVARLRSWLPTKTGKVFPERWAATRSGAEMLRSDLKRAGIAYRDEQGRYVDFHALRHTFITQLARSGVHPAKAKALARHSTITLTMDVYSHVETDELRGALEMLPPLT